MWSRLSISPAVGFHLDLVLGSVDQIAGGGVAVVTLLKLHAPLPHRGSPRPAGVGRGLAQRAVGGRVPVQVGVELGVMVVTFLGGTQRPGPH